MRAFCTLGGPVGGPCYDLACASMRLHACMFVRICMYPCRYANKNTRCVCV